MSALKLTQAEAERLLTMLKRTLKEKVDFPTKGDSVEFDVVGDTNRDIFAINMFRGKRNVQKYNIGARIKKNGVLLLELHVNPGNVHINPNGEKILGSHWHIYSEKYGRRMAFPAKVEDDTFVETSIEFLKKFNVIERPDVRYQLELL